MADFAKLALDVSKIESAIFSYPGAKSVKKITPSNGYDGYEIQPNTEHQAAGLLHVYHRNDGLTTLQPKVGKNQALSQQVAQHVADTCVLSAKFEPGPLSLKSISPQDWAFLQESLATDGFTLVATAHQDAERFSVTGAGKDVVYIHRFKTGRFLLQGRPHSAYSAVVNCLSYTSTERKELIDAQVATVSVASVDSKSLLAELGERIPTAAGKMNEILLTILAPALLVRKLAADLPDYSMMVYPALRGMEGCIKDLFSKNGYVLGRRLSLGDQFDPVTRKVTPAVEAKLGCRETSSAVEIIYDIFSSHRNSLLHVDSIVATTRVIENQVEAIAIVDSALFAIEKAYGCIP